MTINIELYNKLFDSCNLLFDKIHICNIIKHIHHLTPLDN